MAEYFQRTSDKCLSNHWTENDTNWSSFFNCCTSGSMAEISWRFAKNRLADPTYLLKANIRVTENCQVCEKITANAWHMIIECPLAKEIWGLVIAWASNIWQGRRLSLVDALCGVKENNRSDILINFLTNSAKFYIYVQLITAMKNDTHPTSLRDGYLKGIKSKILITFSWHKGMNKMDSFKDQWCIGEVLCSVNRGGELKWGGVLDL
uniref:Reverse transcriptase zinc-binding domain-containing protein n=1 Tax=Photinus pyralis TaxID=7054 RepID=A0A1Y1N9G5_PHOPY